MVRGDLGTLISQEALEPRLHSPHGSRDLEVDFFFLGGQNWPILNGQVGVFGCEQNME